MSQTTHSIQTDLELSTGNFTINAEKALKEFQSKAEEYCGKVQEEFNKLKLDIKINIPEAEKKKIEDLIEKLNQAGSTINTENIAKSLENTFERLKQLQEQMDVVTKAFEGGPAKLKLFEGLSEEISKAINGFGELKTIVNSIQNVENTTARAGKVSTTKEILNQWSGVEKKFKSVADAADKINLTKQKKEVQELVAEYQKYLNMGGKNPLSSLTNNTQTQKKLSNVYEKHIQSLQTAQKESSLPEPKGTKGGPSIKAQTSSKNIVADIEKLEAEKNKVAEIKNEVNILKEALREKTQEIVKEEAQMRASASKEVNSVLSIKNVIVELQTEVGKLSQSFYVSSENSTTSVAKQMASYVQILSKVQQLSSEIKTIAKVKLPNLKVQTVKNEEGKVNNSVSKELRSIANVSDKAENISALANTLKGIATSLIEIDKCINVPDIFNGMNVKKGVGEKLSSIATGLNDIKHALDGLSTDKLTFLNEINGILQKSDALKDLAKAVTGNAVQVKKSINAKQIKQASNEEKVQKTIDTFNSKRAVQDKSFEQSNEYKAAQDMIDKLQEKLNSGDTFTKKEIENANVLVKKYQEALRLGNEFVGNASSQTEAYSAALKSISSNGGKVKETGNWVRDSRTGIEKMTFEVVNSKNEFEKWQASYSNGVVTMSNKTKVVQKNVEGFSKVMTSLRKKIGDVSEYMTAIWLNPYKLISMCKEGITVVNELNKSLTEMRKVSNAPVETLKAFQKQSFNTARDTGSTAKQIQDSTADWMRLGESLDKAKESAKTTSILKNVSEFDDISSATQSLTAISQAYSDLDKIEIVDKLNEIGNNYSISTDKLAVGLQKSGSTLALLGNTLDESAAIITAANATMQDVDVVANGVKTISLRILGTDEAKKELSTNGDTIDEYVTQTASTKQNIIKKYTAVESNNRQGVSLLDDVGNYRNVYDVLLDISEVYKEIQEEDKKFGTNRATALIEQLGGKQRANVVASILQNGELLKAVKESSENADGSAQAELNKYLSSTEGKISQLTTSLQQFWSESFSSETINDIISILDKLLHLMTAISKIEPFGGLAGIGSVAMSFMDKINGSKLTEVKDGKFRLARENVNITDKTIADATSFVDELNKGNLKRGEFYGSDSAFQNFVNKLKEENLKDIKNKDDILKLFEQKNEGRYSSGFLNVVLGDTQETNMKSKVVSGLGKGFRHLGSFVANTAFSMLKGAAATAAFDLALKGVSFAIDYVANYNDNLIDKANELTNTLEGERKTIEDNKKSINSLREEFELLSKGVSTYGANISLSETDFARYNEIVQQIADISPTLVEGWDSETGAIINKNTALQETIDLLKEEEELQGKKETSLENVQTIGKGKVAEYKKKKGGKIITAK